MKEHFPGYYRRSPQEIKSLWSSAHIVFDANVLLDFHRYEPETSETYLALASQFRDRLWVPFQAVQEYHVNRGAVRSAATSVHDDQIGLVSKLITSLNQAPRKSQLTTGEKHKSLLAAATELLTELESARKSVADRNAADADDPILNSLTDLLSDSRIGVKPTDEELRQLYKVGAERFASKVPPGYMDAGKKPENRQYGDFILWHQVMCFARDNDIDIIFVTEDAKEDWWISVHGKQIMPRPELVNEFTEFTGGRTIHFYNGLSFFDYAAQEVGTASTPEALEAARKDLEEVALTRAEELAESTLDELFAKSRHQGLLDTSHEAVTSGLKEEPTGAGPAYSDSPEDLHTRIDELETNIVRLSRHMTARNAAGPETDDPVTQRLVEEMRRLRRELYILYRSANLTSGQARARERILLWEFEHGET
ncbi:PIN domain-containing protein [Arthrobacter sp. zg-Y1143]|uniref:PIN domain-containing protein n=1 Tax=Arthrobacter sp. zg-Y1143 TaxID=3049065 RepID=UPI0024C2346F|nr:PIN domain-containing protein [Arthrobacter sp. zg-Y1143]MDK1327563.1 PIN domain-containing protein [Arthrobacter sp. zg-Y1143]